MYKSAFGTVYGLSVYIIAAILPAVLLMSYIYNRDHIDREPGYLIRKLIIGGLWAAGTAMILEHAEEYLQYPLIDHVSVEAYALVTAIAVGLIEEGAKFFFMKKYTWNDPNFNYRFDGVVYAVFVSLGFAAIENVLYVIFYGGLSIALTRAILTIPAHMGFSVFMGSFYARAKICDVHLDRGGKMLNLAASYLSAVCLHSVYDGLLMVGTDFSMMLFTPFVIAMDLAVFVHIRKESKNDRSIY